MSDITFTGAMTEWAKHRPPKIITHISPSMIGRCMRTHYWAIKGLQQTTVPNPGAILNFQVGFLWEKIVADALRENKTPFLEQYKMYDEVLNVEGTLDFAPIVDIPSLELEVWDSKTEGMMAMQYRKREHHTFFEHHPEYAQQLTTYAILLERQGFNVKRGRFGIIIKDNGAVFEESMTFTDEMKRTVMNRIIRLNEYLKADKLPPCECAGWQVGYCNFGDVDTQAPNSKGKIINTKCCSEDLETTRIKEIIK